MKGIKKETKMERQGNEGGSLVFVQLGIFPNNSERVGWLVGWYEDDDDV